MRRKLKNNKGFAMAELLAVSMVILLLFSILFSNYLPLVAEYENRLSYNDVTAEYAGYYVRKMYLTDNNELSSSTKRFINNGIVGKSFYKVYDKNASINKVCEQYVVNEQDGDKKDIAKKYCNSILEEYAVEEIIITNYSMTDVKSKYTKSSGKLYKYIQYLPEYKNTIYTGNNDLYRIILKTKDGYATTPIDTDYYTPGSCFTGRSVSGGIEITKYNMTGSDCGSMVTIRKDKNLTMKNSAGKSITGKVVFIGNSAFKGLGITSINLNGMVKSIGASAFEGSKLERIDLSGVTSIGDSAFKNTQISSIDIPSSVTIVGKEVFANNSELTSIKINNSAVSVGEFMNSGNSSADIISIDLGNITNIEANMFKNFKFSSNSTVKMSKVTSIGDSAFEGSKLERIDLSGVTSIGDSAFKNTQISSIDIPSSVTIVGKEVFANNSELTSIKINNSAVSVGEFMNSGNSSADIISIDLGNITNIEANMFKNFKFSSNSTVKMSKVTSIGDSAFEGSKLERIDLSGVTSVGEKAFALSSGSSNILPKVDLSSVTVLGNNAFENRKINELDLSGSSITSISKFAFKSCGIFSVTFSDKITSVGEGSFEGNNFNKIDLPSSLTNIGVNAFKENSNITSFDLPASLNVIGNGAFDSWSKLETINNNSTKFNDYDNWCMVVASDDTSCKSEKSDTGYAIGIGDRLINVVNNNGNKISENGGNGNE